MRKKNLIMADECAFVCVMRAKRKSSAHRMMCKCNKWMRARSVIPTFKIKLDRQIAIEMENESNTKIKTTTGKYTKSYWIWYACVRAYACKVNCTPCVETKNDRCRAYSFSWICVCEALYFVYFSFAFIIVACVFSIFFFFIASILISVFIYFEWVNFVFLNAFLFWWCDEYTHLDSVMSKKFFSTSRIFVQFIFLRRLAAFYFLRFWNFSRVFFCTFGFFFSLWNSFSINGN